MSKSESTNHNGSQPDAGSQQEKPQQDNSTQANPNASQVIRRGFVPDKIQPQHLEKLAIVYVRQSSPHQMEEHKESLDRQYALKHVAIQFGWHPDRVLVIDEDLGLSGRNAQNRNGFQKLLAEVTMDHVGMVLGLEMSRFARSCKDWHHLLDLCGVFDVLLADQDGVYDPADPNDRLLLGLKGTMSEVELHTMRNRLQRGLLNKARRGELFMAAPIGFVKDEQGLLVFDPDEQARGAVQMVFDKFRELGAAAAVFRYMRDHDIRLGVRQNRGPDRGKLVWRPVSRGGVVSMLHHPAYAGAYVFGRHRQDRKRCTDGKQRRVSLSQIEDWKVLIPDKFPGYITWDQYLANRERLHQNRTTMATRGTARGGGALLAGIVHCGKCGTHLRAMHTKAHQPRYECQMHLQRHEPKSCLGFRASPVDGIVTREILRLVQPGSLDAALQAINDLQQERVRLDANWQQNLERARYETTKAERHYRAVDPENRLVARTLEEQWEDALRKERSVQEDYERFRNDGPSALAANEVERVQSLAANLPQVWDSPSTSDIDRQEVARCLIERVDLFMCPEGQENGRMVITWAGGQTSEHRFFRPTRSYKDMEHFDEIRGMLADGRERGLTHAQIADELNQRGFRPPTERCETFNGPVVMQLARRLGLAKHRRRDILEPNEWWLREFAESLGVSTNRVRYWVQNDSIHWRRLAGGQYVVWVDEAERTRLEQLAAWPSSRPAPAELTTRATRRESERTGSRKAKAASKKSKTASTAKRKSETPNVTVNPSKGSKPKTRKAKTKSAAKTTRTPSRKKKK